LTAAVPKFCLALEEHRRTPDGRVRTSQELLAHFFPHDGSTSTDRIFKFMPNDVRGPMLAAWGIRGAKAALRDDDAKVQSVVHDALVAGDLDHTALEEGLRPDVLVKWAPLGDWWTFWRGGKLSKNALQKALVTAYELALFDAKWFLDTIDSRGGKLKGTDVLADGLAKEDLTEWMRKIHESGDGSPRGIVAALGWDKIVAKTTNDVLIAVLDAMVTKVGLAKPAEGATGGSKSVAPPGKSVPPADIDWNEPDKQGAAPEIETTVSQTGALAALAGAADEASDIVVVDEVDMNDTGVGVTPPGVRDDPPTSPKVLAADPVEPEEPARQKSSLSKRPEPSAPPAARPLRSR
jgi:hypothetical protein